MTFLFLRNVRELLLLLLPGILRKPLSHYEAAYGNSMGFHNPCMYICIGCEGLYLKVATKEM